MRHKMQIELEQAGAINPLLTVRTYSFGNGLWRRIFGGHKFIVLIPGRTVDTVTITEIGEQSNDDAH